MKTLIFFGIVLLLGLGVAVYYFFPESKIPEGRSVDRIEVFKAEKRMMVYSGDELLKSYSVSLERKRERDRFDDDEGEKLPEGEYVVSDKNNRSNLNKSIYFTSVDEYDLIRTEKKKQDRGSTMQIHAMKRGYGFVGKFHRWFDWTKGGVAITDDEMEDLFKKVETGARVKINP